MGEYRPARKRIDVSVGESVRILRELQELTQSQLGELTGIAQATISAIENDRVKLGVERAKVLARALNCQPAVLVFPSWETAFESAARCEVHRITSSARSSSDGGIVRPRALAVFRLITSSNRVGCSIGNSAGVAPRRMRSTKVAAMRNRSGVFAQ
jgi:transcriptional regulator with XRE-family HTH domain